MYEVFDPYCASPTFLAWHHTDRQGFYRALDSVVRHPNFDAHRMAEYIMKKTARTHEWDAEDMDTINGMVEVARSVQEFLEATKPEPAI